MSLVWPWYKKWVAFQFSKAINAITCTGAMPTITDYKSAKCIRINPSWPFIEQLAALMRCERNRRRDNSTASAIALGYSVFSSDLYQIALMIDKTAQVSIMDEDNNRHFVSGAKVVDVNRPDAFAFLAENRAGENPVHIQPSGESKRYAERWRSDHGIESFVTLSIDSIYVMCEDGSSQWVSATAQRDFQDLRERISAAGISVVVFGDPLVMFDAGMGVFAEACSNMDLRLAMYDTSILNITFGPGTGLAAAALANVDVILFNYDNEVRTVECFITDADSRIDKDDVINSPIFPSPLDTPAYSSPFL